jgi:transcriptional regulator with XRE-family HTH domain
MSPEMLKQLNLDQGVPADLSEMLVNYKKKHGLSQFQMAEKIGIELSRFQLIEYGLTNIPFLTYQRIISVIS